MRGLSGRSFLPEGRGMLFVFEKPGRHGFWMKDMKFAIDIIWIDEGFRVKGVSSNISPQSFPRTFQPPEPIRWALEVTNGWAETHEVKQGDKVDISQ